ncbi:tRNA (N(6)-L-threonylcarbamoyladenosine(37)-C(2))-methylthiotransferase MtaB [Campylobacter geochelonis]|uniref:MiaB-like tRNA modifying enzyme n=1 Tax=Campylobacter geochelonis TaxID=1780362 RepID=A0A128EKG3_9BACT|nr:tRNA (N(6)-L-threonylcarbamoyladenosine(37)-C(2))-methylthiotransferase MtaB [Campylobacter geochelonis]QKF71202.1 putative tRNA (N6-L-threonylcarbamoyladenosine37-C2)-methylthiotransferase MtaB [Campylobacter geochelonis]CZE48828.1 MiaB-like tRNA modifying enzyme [Campylobacter geochelonis]
MKIYFKTFGCRTNIYDTEFMKSSLKEHDVVEDESLADVIVINSCTVTNGADSDVRNYINRTQRKGKKVFLTGCGAISKGEELFKDKKVFGVFGMSKKADINRFLEQKSEFIELGNLTSRDENIVTSYENHTKAFIKIQEGCDFRCSYCIIPLVRGNARSQDENGIINEAKNLVKNGFNELVLTGTNIGSYGKDTNTTLGKLLQKLGAINGLKRVRLGSLEPSQIDESFKEILDEPWLEKHLHIALQHTSQKMLSIMHRRNRALKDIELFNELSQMGFALGTDFIVGHPGESEAVWDEAVENFKKFPLTHIHAFVYSKRDGTLSADMRVEVDGKTAKERLKLLQNIVSLNNFEFRKRHYNVLSVLVEQKSGEFYTGFDQFYNKIQIKSDKNLKNRWIEIGDYDVEFAGNFAEI